MKTLFAAGLRGCGAAGLVLMTGWGEAKAFTLTASRRLALAAAQGKATAILVRARPQHLMAQRRFDRSAELNNLSSDYEPVIELSGADEFAHPQHPRNLRILPGSRDFH